MSHTLRRTGTHRRKNALTARQVENLLSAELHRIDASTAAQSDGVAAFREEAASLISRSRLSENDVEQVIRNIADPSQV